MSTPFFAGDEEDLSGSELIAMEGEAELMGFSIGKALRKTKNVAKAVAKPVAKVAVKTAGVVKRNAAPIAAVVATGGLSKLAPKSLQKKIGTAVLGVSTGGVSLVATKSGKNLVGSAARGVQKNVLRPTAGAAMSVARSPIGKSLVSTGLTAGSSLIPGGGAALAATRKVQSLARSKKPAKPAPVLAKVKPKTVAVPTKQIKRAPRPMMPQVIPAAPVPMEAAAAPESLLTSKPVLIGGAVALGLLGLVMARSGSGKR
jgi:hypothetical protein